MTNKEQPPPEAVRSLLAAADCAVSWWKHQKPIGWGIRMHLANPTVNCATEREKRLARAAARWYLAQHPNGGARSD